MPSPVYAAGPAGGLISVANFLSGSSAAAYLDLSTCVEGQVTCEMYSGASTPTTGVTFSAYKVYGNTAPITLAAAVTAGQASTTLSVSDATHLHQGQQFLVQQAAGSKLGEVVKVSGAITGTGPYSVPVTGKGAGGGTVNAYASGDAVYLMAQTADAQVTPGVSAGAWAANADYTRPLYLGTGQWAIAAAGDSVQTSIAASVDRITGYA